MKVQSVVSRLVAVSLMAGISWASSAAVEESNFSLDTTGDLYRLCAATDEDPNFVAATYMCRGFMEGVHEYHDAITASGKMRRLTCTPEGTTLAEARVVFLAWGAQNNADVALMGEPPVDGLLRSLSARFPCDK